MNTLCVRILVVAVVASASVVRAQNSPTDPGPLRSATGATTTSADARQASAPAAVGPTIPRGSFRPALRLADEAAVASWTMNALEPAFEPGSSHRGRNVLIGAGIGAAAGGVLAAATCNGDCMLSVGMVIAPLGGAAVGALIALLLTPVR